MVVVGLVVVSVVRGGDISRVLILLVGVVVWIVRLLLRV